MSTRSEIRDRWLSILQRQRGSGLTITAFCQRARVAQSCFFKWRRKLGNQLTFAEVKLRPSPGAGELELRLPGRRSIVVPQGFDRPTLIELLDVLDARSVAMAAREAGL